MNLNRFLILFSILILNYADSSAQGFKIKINKTEFQVGETITVTFYTSSEHDSIGKVDLPDFEIKSGPSTNESVNYINGVKSGNYEMTYELVSLKTGEAKITAPVIYLRGRMINGDEKVVQVYGEQLSDESLKEAQWNLFVDKAAKPEGTIRMVYKDDMGYLDEFKNGEWVFKRRLTKREIDQLNNIK